MAAVGNKDTLLYKAMLKYGTLNFKIETLLKCSNDELDFYEKKYINEYNSCILNKNSNGYNMTLGGEGSSRITQEILNEMIKLYNKGYPLNDIVKKLHSTIETVSFYLKKELNITDEEIKLRGYKIRSERRYKPVIQYDLNMNFINEFNSQKEASKFTGIHQNHIGEVCRGKRQTAGGYRWRWKIKKEIMINE